MIAKAYAKANLPAPGEEPRSTYLRTNKAWNEEQRRRMETFDFWASRDDATRFPDEAEAWAAFDRSGYCGREYFSIEAV